MPSSPQKDTQIEIEAANIGPHRQLKAKLKVAKLEIGLFANNGSGKTFLSRVFRLVGRPDIKVDETNKILTLGQSHANFALKITSSRNSKGLSIGLTRGNLPTISNNTDFIFHVFNQDYIRENLDELGYRPNGTIEGFILGKQKIDLTKEKKELEKLALERQEKIQRIKNTIDDVKKNVEGVGVRKNTTEFIAINYDNLINQPTKYNDPESFQALKDRLAKLKTFPDNLADLRTENTIYIPRTLKDITEFLGTEFTKSKVAEDFKVKVKTKQEFIERGLVLKGDNGKNCPFCEQELNRSALDLIDEYLQYLNDEEAKQIKKANGYISSLGQIKDSFTHAYQQSLKTIEQFNKLKGYLPSLETTILSPIEDPSQLNENFQSIIEYINRKKADVGISIGEGNFRDDFHSITTWISKANECIATTETILNNFNQKKNNVQTERLDLNKRLCKAAYQQIATTQQPLIDNVTKLNIEISNLEIEIKKKEETEKVSKKEKIAADFQFFLRQFFSRKYTFDQTSFCLKFQDHSLADNASDVLSEGEKSIVAFCYFLAETHRIVNTETDYKRLFFVIDDPISSLDFHFVYAVAQTIRSLRTSFPDSKIHFLVLTHNLEFMSILTRNNIIEDKFILFNGNIQELGRSLIMPYEEHLRDIYCVAHTDAQPSHTTANSIRHVLETLNRFSYPNLSLFAFCAKIDNFRDNAFLISLIHDSSHGGIRTQIPYTSEMIKTGCSLIIQYLEKHHSGQVEILKS